MRSSFSQDVFSRSIEKKIIQKENKHPIQNYFTNKDKPRTNRSPLCLGLKKINSRGHSSNVTLKKKQYAINELQNLKLIQNYQKQFSKQNKSIHHYRFLSKHDVACEHRAKMVDWMVEVITSFKCSDRSLFKAIEVMDSYYLKSQKIQKSQDLHLIGISAILIANKMEEVYPLKLKVLYDQIAHRKFSISEIINKQANIFQTLDYNLNVYSILDSVEMILALFCLNSQHYQKLEKIAIYISKIVAYQYSILSLFSKQVISYAIVQRTLRKGEQIIGKFNATLYLNNLLKQSKQKRSNIMQCYDAIRTLIQTFDLTYHFLPNFKKFTKVVIEGKNLKNYF